MLHIIDTNRIGKDFFEDFTVADVRPQQAAGHETGKADDGLKCQ
jgi:hypothetical protein